MVSFGEMAIWVDAETLEKPLWRVKVWRFGTWECKKPPQVGLFVLWDKFAAGDTVFSSEAMIEEVNSGSEWILVSQVLHVEQKSRNIMGWF